LGKGEEEREEEETERGEGRGETSRLDEKQSIALSPT
jgi:hypothetical protein